MKEARVNTWEFHEKGLNGHTIIDNKHISCPKPTTRRRLYILAHECGLIALKHKKSGLSHRIEYEAEMYAHDALRRHAISVPRKETENAKRYVAKKVDQAIRMGKAKQLDKQAVEWCKEFHRNSTISALNAKTVVLKDLSALKSISSP